MVAKGVQLKICNKLQNNHLNFIYNHVENEYNIINAMFNINHTYSMANLTTQGKRHILIWNGNMLKMYYGCDRLIWKNSSVT